MAIQCTYSNSRGLTLPGAYCKIIGLSLTEYSELEGKRYARITVGIWASAELRGTVTTPITTEQVVVSNGFFMADIDSEAVELNRYDEVFGADVLDAGGVNPVSAAYAHLATLPMFSTNLQNV